jgi:aerobic-type carbon monoxide dehydrogenase small subunit (CoxS/CutS family)
MPVITLVVNGRRRSVDAPPDTPLLWVLRDELKLKGTKYSCGISECGSCTVHLDGAPVRSCSTPLSAAAGRHITTIEGLGGKAGVLHALQKAWIAEEVVQCGYCQPGMIMQAAALLAKNGNPTDDEIDRWMSGNLCRCGTYSRIRKAIRRAARGDAAVQTTEAAHD